MVLLFWGAILLVFLVSLYIYGTWTYDYFAKRGIPFDPPTVFVGNQGAMMARRKHMFYFMHDMYTQHKHHKVAGFFELRRPVYLINDPDMIKLISVKDAEYFLDHRSVIDESLEPLLGKGLVSLQGQKWKDMRSTLSPAFTSSKMKAMFILVRKCGEQMGDYLEKKCTESSEGIESVELKEFFTRYTNDVIATSALGVHVDSLAQPDNEFYKMGTEISKVTAKRIMVFLLYMTFPKLMKALSISMLPGRIKTFFRSLIHDTIATREKEGIIRPDMIHLLMQARRGTLAHEEGGEGEVTRRIELDDDDITANALLFYLAGFETTSTCLCFMAHLLAAHPDVQARLQQEIDGVLDSHGGQVTYEGVQKMKYLDMVMSETLRMYPPASLTDRKCIKPYVLKDEDSGREYKLDKGDGVWIPIAGMQMDPQYFADPEKFCPERFSEENKHNIKPFTYLPFGAGPRNCIGMRFAQMETKIAIVCLLRRFNMEVVAKTTLPLVFDAKTFNMLPKGGFWIGFKPRRIS